MTIIFTDETALEFWRWQARTQGRFMDHEPVQGSIEAPRAPGLRAVREECSRFRSTTGPIHVLACDAQRSHPVPDIALHSRRNPLPAGSCVRLPGETWVVSPEMLFIQMGRRLDQVSLIQLGYELCGSYAIAAPEHDLRGFCRTEPLVTLARITRFLDGATGEHGIQGARAAARFVCESAASPREAAASMLLTLPPRLGGYGLEAPLLNHRIDLSPSEQQTLGRAFLRADMLWPRAKLVLEYDSDAWHADKARLNYDSQRRNLLRSIGYEVISLTNSEIKSLAHLDRIVRSIRKALGCRFRTSIRDYELRKRELHQRLVFHQPTNLAG